MGTEIIENAKPLNLSVTDIVKIATGQCTIRILSAVLAMPIVLYTLQIFWWASVWLFKTGWTSRPLVWIYGPNILIFIGYSVSIILLCGYRTKVRKDHFVVFSLVLVAFLTGMFLVAIAIGGIGIL